MKSSVRRRAALAAAGWLLALSALAAFDARKSQVAELRFFGGLSLEETGHVLGISVATVEREWQAARAWLYARLTGTSA